MADLTKLKGDELALAAAKVLAPRFPFGIPLSLLDPDTDGVKIRWLLDSQPYGKIEIEFFLDYHVSLLNGRSTVACWQGLTFSEALCRLIVAVGGDRG